MRNHTLTTALLAAAGVALATAATTAAAPLPSASPSPRRAASPAASTRQAPRVVVVDCFSRPQVRPVNYLIACGDGNNALVSLRWASWGPNSAVASGQDAVNDCQPYCAAGHFHSYPVMVRLDHPATWQRHPHQRKFTRLSLTYTANRPSQLPRVVSYQLWP